jgi:Protein of unknown function (DUF3102)
MSTPDPVKLTREPPMTERPRPESPVERSRDVSDHPARVALEITPPSQPTKSLPDLTIEIQKAHGKVIQALASGAAAAIEAGEALLQAKALLKAQKGHGSWEDFIALECRLRVRTAQIYMYLAKNKSLLGQLLSANPQAHAVLSQTQALKLLGSARKKRKGLTPRKVPAPAPAG